MVYSRKEINYVFLIALSTIFFLLVIDKIYILLHVVSDNPNISLTQQTNTLSSDKLIDRFSNQWESFNDRLNKTTLIPIIHNSISQKELISVKDVIVNNKLTNVLVKSHSEDVFLSDKFISDKSCPNSVHESYSIINASNKKNIDWCIETKNKFNVQVGRSWGALPKSLKIIWDSNSCNELISIGKLQSCDERWGYPMFSEWLDHKKMSHIIKGENKDAFLSDVKCASNMKANTLCQLRNVVVNFGQLGSVGKSRSFGRGFLTTYGEKIIKTSYPDIPGTLHIEIDRKDSTKYPKVEEICDFIETRPTFVVSNDDIYNLGHYINDVVAIWSITVMANRDTKESLLINIDGVRRGGPAGGESHRLMDERNPDLHGPYIDYYNSWFSEVKKGIEFKKNKVCFKEIYFQPAPGVAWFWNDWGLVNKCSEDASSPLYQSFNLFLRERWIQMYGKESLLLPDIDKVHIVIEVREINKTKRNNHSSARHIKNLQQLIASLNTIPNVRVTAQNFAAIPFKEQVALSHSAGVFISMHGAGTTHIFHSAVGTPNCCALVELQPDYAVGFHDAQGYGNLARMHGLHYYRYLASDGRTTPQGTTVDINIIKKMVQDAVIAVREKPTCLHEVKDTRESIYPINLFDSL